MAQPTTLKGTQLLIKVGDGATPTETFAHPCLINASRSLSFTTETNEILIPDCSNPEDPIWPVIIKTAISASISGAGKLELADLSSYFNWVNSPNSKNCQIVVGVLADVTGGYFSGAFALTDFEMSGDHGEMVECSISLKSDGPLTFTAHA